MFNFKGHLIHRNIWKFLINCNNAPNGAYLYPVTKIPQVNKTFFICISFTIVFPVLWHTFIAKDKIKLQKIMGDKRKMSSNLNSARNFFVFQ